MLLELKIQENTTKTLVKLKVKNQGQNSKIELIIKSHLSNIC